MTKRNPNGSIGNLPAASDLTAEFLRQAFFATLQAGLASVDGNPQAPDAIPKQAALMVAAAAGPIALLGSFIHKRTDEQKEAGRKRFNADDDGESAAVASVSEGVHPDSMLVAMLLVSRCVTMNGTGESLKYDLTFTPEAIADAMRDFHKLTGRDPASFLRSDMVAVAAQAETRAQLAAQGLLDKLRQGPSTPQ